MATAILIAFAVGGSLRVAVASRNEPAIADATATAVFDEASALCHRDAGRLWGVSLCVPIILADPETLEAVANRAPNGTASAGKVYRFRLPKGTAVSTAPFSYYGREWVLLAWPMFGSADIRAVTLMHESFHIVQPSLGFRGGEMADTIAGDPFLDTKDGRTWLRGELHALRAALRANGNARTLALRDAIVMRSYRHTLSHTSAELERQQDILEGLAESTGIDVALTPGERIPYALKDLAYVEQQPSYARAFAYATGPAYSELLDARDPKWRKSVTVESDLAQTAMGAYGITVRTPSKSEAESIIARYGGRVIETEELARAQRKAADAIRFKRELVDGPTISLPLKRFAITFNPRDIETFGSFGSVYHTLHVRAPWGTIHVNQGDALIDKSFTTLTVSAPNVTDRRQIAGAGWMLRLAPGYALRTNPNKPGSFLVRL